MDTVIGSSVATIEQPGQALTRERIDLIKQTVCKGASDTELELFVQVCNRTGLDPFARQIYAIRRYNRDAGGEVMVHQVSIDGLRLIAQRTGRYAGQLPTMWCGSDGVWVDVWLSADPPAAAKAAVLHRDFDEPLTTVATHTEYCQRRRDGSPTPMWAAMPALMLAKCAESLALRKAFPAEMSGLYTEDEMGRAAPAATATPASVEQWSALEAPAVAVGIDFGAIEARVIERASAGLGQPVGSVEDVPDAHLVSAISHLDGMIRTAEEAHAVDHADDEPVDAEVVEVES